MPVSREWRDMVRAVLQIKRLRPFVISVHFFSRYDETMRIVRMRVVGVALMIITTTQVEWIWRRKMQETLRCARLFTRTPSTGGSLALARPMG